MTAFTTLSTSTTTTQLLDTVVALAGRSVPQAAGISVTLLTGNTAATVSSTAGWVLELDNAQYANGCGPCVDAALGGESREMTDAAAETRWPDFVSAAREVLVESSLSVPLPPNGEVLGSLNVFSCGPGGFGESDRTALHQLAAMAAAGLEVEAHTTPTTARAVVDQAKGILMVDGCTAGEALDQLGRTAQESGRDLREVSTELVASIGRT